VLAGDDAAGTLHGAPCPVLVAYARRSGRLVKIGVGYPVYRPDWDELTRLRYEEAERAVEGVEAELGDIATADVTYGDPARELAFAGNHLGDPQAASVAAPVS
jgi:hypothetical protein